MGETTVTMSENLTTAWTWITGRMSAIVSTITDNPIYLIGLGFWTVGGAIGLGYRLIRG